MKNRALAVITALVLAMTAGVAVAADRPGAFTVSPMFGTYWFDDPLVESNKSVMSLGLGYNVNPNWSIEAMFNFAEPKLRAGGAKVNNNVFSLNALYNFEPQGALTPYVGLGAGLRRNDVTGSDDDDELLHLSAGAKYFLNDTVALRVDGRYMIDLDGDQGDYNDYLIQAGFHIQLGGLAKPMKAAAPGDSDGDGVLDDVDRCPNTPKGVKVGADGCPLDSDGDGVYDSFDKCPGTPRGAPVDSSGCPLDSDGDGVPDYLDKCPNTPQGTKVDANGCPIVMPPVRMELNVEFDFDSAKIRPGYQARLGEAAEFLKKHPDAVATIEGHTDSTGPDSYNQKLSERRAASVRDYLVDKEQVSRSRIRTVGYGESRPIAPNTSRDGRQRNRRVIAVIIEVR